MGFRKNLSKKQNHTFLWSSFQLGKGKRQQKQNQAFYWASWCVGGETRRASPATPSPPKVIHWLILSEMTSTEVKEIPRCLNCLVDFEAGDLGIYLEGGSVYCGNCWEFPPVLVLKSKVLFYFNVFSMFSSNLMF